MKNNLEQATLTLLVTMLSIFRATSVNSQTLPIYSLYTDGSKLYAGSTGVILISMDDGNSWVMLDSGGIKDSNYQFNNDVASIATLGMNIYAISDEDWGFAGPNELWQSSNNGSAWKELSVPPLTQNNAMNSIISDNSLLIALTLNGIFRSADSGKTWTIANDSLVSWYWPICLIKDSSRLYAGTSKGVFRSTDRGTTWVSLNDSLTEPGAGPIAANGSLLAAVVDLGLAISTNGGESWFLASDPTANPRDLSDATSIVISGPNIFVSQARSYGVVYETTDLGQTWSVVTYMHRDVALAVSGPNLIVGSYLGGIEVIPLSELAVRPQSVHPYSLSLYPDPITSNTTISFTLPAASQVTLTLTDAAGRETLLMPAQYLSAGQHEVTWDASNYPSGVYLCRLSYGGESATRRVVVMH